MIPRSKWFGYLSHKYIPKCLKPRWKIRSKIFPNYSCLLCGKTFSSRSCLPWNSLTGSEPSSGSPTVVKRLKDGENRKVKNIANNERPKDARHFLVQKLNISPCSYALAKMSWNAMLAKGKAVFCKMLLFNLIKTSVA